MSEEIVGDHADLFPEATALGTRAARVVERIGDRPAGRRFAHAREQEAQHAMDVGHRADGGMRSAAEPLLVNDHAMVRFSIASASGWGTWAGSCG